MANYWFTEQQRRLDPASLRQWLPRVFRFVYRRLREIGFPVGDVSFLVAASIAGKPTRIPKPRVWDFLATKQVDHGFNNHLALRIGPNFNQAGPYYDVRESCCGMLYQLDSPEFVAKDFPPLSFAAIGSGASARAELEAYEIVLATCHPARTAEWFLDALIGFLHKTDLTSVGGWILGAEAIDGKVRSLPYRFDAAGGTREVGMKAQGDRFVLFDGGDRQVTLLYPSELRPSGPQAIDVSKNLPADDLKRRADLLNRLAAAAEPRFKP